MNVTSARFEVADELPETAPRRFQIAGPKFLSGPAGGAASGCWALASPALDETLRVVWEVDGEVLTPGSWITNVAFDLEDHQPGELLRRTLRVRVYSSGSSVESPEREILIGVAS